MLYIAITAGMIGEFIDTRNALVIKSHLQIYLHNMTKKFILLKVHSVPSYIFG